MDRLPTAAEIEEAAAWIYRHMAPTPAYRWPLLEEALGTELWVKHENHTPIGAFKIRGGLVHLRNLKAGNPAIRGVITATRGNHGQSVALAARHLGIPATVVVPEGNSQEKNAAMRAFGAELVVAGADFQDAAEAAEARARQYGLVMVSSFGRDLVEGVATYGRELFEAAGDLDRVYVPIGLGSGICGVISAREALSRTAEVVGVVAEGAPAYALSFREGRAVAHAARTFADGLAVRKPSEAALAVIRRHAADVVTVSEAEIASAMRLLFRATHSTAEGAGAAALAAALRDRDRLSGRRVAVVLSGQNIDTDLFARILGEEA